MDINASIIDQRLESIVDNIQKPAAEELNLIQIINGGQTCLTIFKTLRPLLFKDNNSVVKAYVLIRLYQLPSDNDDLIRKITFATNSQNPVDLKDLRANDERQQTLEMDIEQLGYHYRRKHSDIGPRPSDISSGVTAEAILSVWRKKPHQAKFFSREHFGKLYDLIFTQQLNGSQVVIAVLLYRIAEKRRKRPEAHDPDFVRYASCFIAMQMGKKLLSQMTIQVDEISHKNFSVAQQLIKENKEAYFNDSVADIQKSLQSLYGEQKISLQQLSADFSTGRFNR